jgi:hypothetical protein
MNLILRIKAKKGEGRINFEDDGWRKGEAWPVGRIWKENCRREGVNSRCDGFGRRIAEGRG